MCWRAGRGEGRWAHEDAKARRRGEKKGEGEGEALVVEGRAVSRSFLFVSLCLRVSLHQGALRQRRGRLFDDVSTVTMSVFVKPL